MQPPDKSPPSSNGPANGPATGSTDGLPRVGGLVVWGARIVWVAVAVLGGSAIGQALADHSRAVHRTGTVLAWVGWAVVALAIVVPSTIGLTVVRSVVPAGVVVAVMAATGGADILDAAVAVGLTVLMSALVGAAEFGQVFAQGSAYGHERRFVLRPPVAFMLPAVVTWCLLCAMAVSGPLLLAAGVIWAGAPITVLSVAAGWFLGRRFHLLSRRWLVLVPAGVVVHDQLVLAETVMLARASLASIGLALSDTEAADLTGPAAGHAIEIVLVDQQTVILAPTRAKPSGTALHVRSLLVAPTRPGRLLHAAAAARLPVG